MLLFFLILSWAITVFNFYIKKDYLYPAFLQSTLWSIILTVYYLFGKEFRELSFKTLITLFLCIAFFSISSLVITKLYKPSNMTSKNSSNISLPNVSFMKFITILNILVFPFFLLKLISLTSFSTIFLLSDDISNAKLEGSLSGFAYFMWLSILSSLICFNFFIKNKNKQFYKSYISLFILNFLVSISYVLLFSARNFLIGYLISIVFLLIINNIIGFKKAMLFITLLIAFIFVTYTLVQDSTYLESITYQSNYKTIYNLVLIYLIGSLSAFDYTVSNIHMDYEMGINTFRIVLLRLNDIGFNFSVPPIVKEFVFVPFPTNVYTFLFPYYKDFGVIGIIIINSFLGCMHTIIYMKAKVGGFYSQIVYVLTLEALFYQFFTDFYFTILTKWVFYILILYFVKNMKKVRV